MRAVLEPNFAKTIEECFATDPALIEKWHIAAGRGLDQCIRQTVADLAEADPSFQFYKIVDDQELIGYFGSEFGRYLTTIFVKPQFRNRRFMADAWNLIKSHFDGEFTAAIYAKNLPCMKFYSRNGKAVRAFEHRGDVAVEFRFER